ncbi:hypothetical protein [uncultured Dokdonia sp.]|uniref:hypothetical protein n=1 Tax=uncultured Dokdonia sp. TaxID=575653 RepID=UPI002628F920|nr:hypothetical protein [uncultured Dokdonia sp.]
MKEDTSLSKEQIIQACVEKRFKTLHLPFVTNRQLHHWKATGLLNEHRELASSGKKNEFDFFEVVWIRCIVLMRSFGIDNLLIAKVNKDITGKDQDSKDTLLSIFQNKIAEALFRKQGSFLLVSEQGDGRLLSKEMYSKAIKDSLIRHHLSLDIAPLIKEILLLLDFDIHIQRITNYYLDKE